MEVSLFADISSKMGGVGQVVFALRTEERGWRGREEVGAFPTDLLG